ncbi:hypothetical protein D3C86_1153140 [compost metagenome]
MGHGDPLRGAADRRGGGRDPGASDRSRCPDPPGGGGARPSAGPGDPHGRGLSAGPDLRRGPGYQAWRLRGRLAGCQHPHRRHLHDPLGAPQPHRASRHHRQLGGTAPHRPRRHPVGVRRPGRARADPRPEARAGPGGLALRRRRLRLQGHDLAARAVRRPRRSGGGAAGEARGDARSDVRADRLSPHPAPARSARGHGRWQAHGDRPRRHQRGFSPGDLRRARGSDDPDALRLPQHMGEAPGGGPGHPDANLHACPGRSNGQLCAGVGHGRARVRPGDGPARAAPGKLRRARRVPGPALVEQGASRLL